MQSRKELISYLENISLFILGLTLLVFPLTFATLTTDAFTLPKQILLGVSVLAILVLFAVKIVSAGKVAIRRTPFDLPIVLLIIATLVSSLFAVNRADSLAAFVPFFLCSFLYFVIVNIIKDRKSFVFLSSSFVLGAFILSAFSILSFFKIYPLPFSFAQNQTFSTLGSQLDQFIYLLISLSLALSLSWSLINRITKRINSPFEKGKILSESGTFAAAVVILAAVIVTGISLVKLQKPIILPLETGFQTAFAQISQDTGRVAQGFLFGSGFGTYVTDFSRFKQVAFNQNATLWSLTFVRSSSFVLELLATTGILGLAAFLLLVYRLLKEKNYFLPVILAVTAAFILPLSFATQTLLFIIIGLWAASLGISGKKQHKYFEVELQLVALRNGIINLSSDVSANTRSELNRFLPVIFAAIILATCAVIGFFGVKYVLADVTFQQSLVVASQNNGSKTYQLQSQAINTFGQRDAFYRIFSQTNLALASSLTSQVPKGSSPSAQVQQTVLTLTQQAINAARQATTVSPRTSTNWSNLSSVYRSLIGFGQNAESFAVVSQQQSVALDPNNPQEYINLGGIYYQLAQWDNAQSQFQIAINLKPDLANSYYNLGHVLEQKGDLKNALIQYQTVKNLVLNDKASLDQINKEIDAIQKKIAEGATTGTQTTGQTPLQVNTPQTKLPVQNPPIQIPSPPATSSAK